MYQIWWIRLWSEADNMWYGVYTMRSLPASLCDRTGICCFCVLILAGRHSRLWNNCGAVQVWCDLGINWPLSLQSVRLTGVHDRANVAKHILYVFICSNAAKTSPHTRNQCMHERMSRCWAQGRSVHMHEGLMPHLSQLSTEMCMWITRRLEDEWEEFAQRVQEVESKQDEQESSRIKVRTSLLCYVIFTAITACYTQFVCTVW